MSEPTFYRTATLAAEVHARELLLHPGTIAVGVGLRTVAGRTTAQPAVKIFVERKFPPTMMTPMNLLPRALSSPDGGTAAVDVEQIAPIEVPPPRLTRQRFVVSSGLLFGVYHPLRSYMRPAVGGASIANSRFSVGTVTVGVRDANGLSYALSCNHVLGLMGQAQPGDPIVQPSPEDGGFVPVSQIGTFARAAPMDFSPGALNRVDGALALVPPGYVLPAVWVFGVPAGCAPPASVHVRQRVWKVGRTTGVTFGHVVATNVLVRANYSRIGGPVGGYLAQQILTTGMAEFGDSGALLVDGSLRAVGMLCGGSATHCVYNRMDNVLKALSVML